MKTSDLKILVNAFEQKYQRAKICKMSNPDGLRRVIGYDNFITISDKQGVITCSDIDELLKTILAGKYIRNKKHTFSDTLKGRRKVSFEIIKNPERKKMTSRRYFVYGTLMKGLRNHILFENFIAEKNINAIPAETNGIMYPLYSGSFPGVIFSSAAGKIKGEIIIVSAESEDILNKLDAALDRLESMYIPITILINKKPCKTYQIKEQYVSGLPVIEDGDFKNYIKAGK